jgi:hypothetical protein
MKIISGFLCGFFILLAQDGFAQIAVSEPQSRNFFGLKNDSFNYSK